VKRLVAIALGLAAVAVLAASLPSAGLFGRGAAGGLGALREVGEVPVGPVARRDFVHLVPAEGNLRAARSTTVSVPMAAPGPFHVAWVAPDGSRVRAGEVLVRFDPTDLVKALDDAEGDLASARLKTDKQRSSDLAEIDKLQRDVAMARVELANAMQFQKKDELIFSRHDIIQSQIDQQLAGERERHAREQRRNQETLGRADLDLLAIDVRKAEVKIRQARAGLSALRVTAPHDGVVMLRRLGFMSDPPRVGDTVWSGMPLAEIPDLSIMQAEVYVLEADAGGLAAGKPATVAVESDPGVEHAARIARVDTLAKPRLKGSPVQFFAVTLALARTDPRVMKPGQRVKAVLRLEERRGALVVPRQAVFQRDGRNVVYRRRAGGRAFEAEPVELGPSDIGSTVITSGIAAGDLVALRDPTRAAAGAPPPARAPRLPAAGRMAAPGGAALP
jgi:HlyD family secretion protein